MRAIMVMFDSLNRHMLPPYGGDWIHAPNFQRLAERSVTFDNCYVGSMPCMPARRELQTGRYNFLHRSWGPLEPFDDSMPEILRKNGIYTHLVSDHYHYWEPGGATYHTKYNTWEFCRGQEGDPWKGEVKDPQIPDHVGSFEGHRKKLFRQDWINRKYMHEEELHSQAQTFSKGLEFIQVNHDQDSWFLQIEVFDPHEPFFSHQKYKNLYPHEYTGRHFDWPHYKRVDETAEEIEHCRYEYAALVSMCDAYLGKVLDVMDELDMWQDTMLTVNADHGFLLGEHEWWAKNDMPFYNEIARPPLFIWDPRSGRKNARCDCLVQMIDIPATLLDFFGAPIPKDMLGKPLKDAISHNKPVREAALFGLHGAHVNCTDGRYVYMRAPAHAENEPLYNYTLMPAHMPAMFSVEELKTLELAEPFSFTKGVKTMKIKANIFVKSHAFGTLLFDLADDPGQMNPIQDPVIEEMMIGHMICIMKENDAPVEQYERLGFPLVWGNNQRSKEDRRDQ
jgi:arylsulfatase A-like enzyme